ncbi:bacillithiol biosynthesis cysteine-adding enzyme BshC [Myroides marinus]|uniref:bacillithiol biosynthesis cysteine-adding enzyme BshC n=1 Tax=Myroides marinus TaxID=703342 RepID=UPI002576FD64|nr:bacillithiol biosynthesis cysteine-adding enzyme BshC [Myroides marinus]MDM1367910.1 bacillithiol biosynthesis cysteine-adding enzyme BshC [Myroides marinus]MDM1375291.1 bacillithiol biosynthesis cysteine-adding enzyme BshC [Myroides marinus]MDM1377572.1 bacillithiol biosynthesis cysteine-adding enzyme BshC [Myroides marinus]MDM1382483.1 bacillithiol biosynthesis cysteine-adding enzyme BshC [Myroides marinus]MDM1384748.1 bacillithiol biosynthesis cysteine-adding enzyme BshC [Myroides marinu
MPLDKITFQNAGYFSKLMVDYLNQEDSLRHLYNHFPTIQNFKQQIDEKRANYPAAHRAVLCQALLSQYKNTKASDKTLDNIHALAQENTFTVTTGHQLNLFTGPLYFLYKIISVINLAKELKAKYPTDNFVPVYWMATEDHDFEEINHFVFEEKVICWNRESKGPVGRLSTEGLDKVFEVFKSHIGVGTNATRIKELFENAYLKHDNLTDATRYLANELFAAYGLVIIDGDDAELKKLFAPHIKEELINQSAIKEVEKSYATLADYFIQVNPREINLFYIQDNLRERIIFEDEVYKVNNTSITFAKEAILEELDKHPERFSPNVILRPLYQEVILPNLCYTGGGGELAYWLELKKVFDLHKVTFPMLLLRNSVLLATSKQVDKLDKLDLTWKDVFTKQGQLINAKTKEFSSIQFDFEEQRKFLEEQFKTLENIALQTDKSFIGAVNAQKVKQLKGLENLEKRLQKAEKRNHAEKLERITLLQNELFPNNSLQERIVNFSVYYKEFGDELITTLFNQLEPLSHEFDIVVL